MEQKPILEIDLNKVLAGLELNMEEFIDLCILCGCDYTSTIKGIGQKRAYELIKKHKTIEKAISKLDSKHQYALQVAGDSGAGRNRLIGLCVVCCRVPSDFLYKEAHELFVTPPLLTAEEVKAQVCTPLGFCPDMKSGEMICVCDVW
jgi:flap endonuclease-1